jgi:hypothetical protein
LFHHVELDYCHGLFELVTAESVAGSAAVSVWGGVVFGYWGGFLVWGEKCLVLLLLLTHFVASVLHFSAVQ